MAKRDEYLARLRTFESDSGKRSLSRDERAAESELLEKVSEADGQIKRHLEAAAAEEQAMRVTSPLQEMGTTRSLGRKVEARMNATPGELMARSLEMSRGITTTGTNKAFSPEEMARTFVDLLAPQSVVMESGVQRVQTGAETYAFPVIRSDFSAGFVGELDDLPTGGFGTDPLKVTPKKIAAADLIANELLDDGGAAFLNPMAKSLIRSVALGFDREALIGTGAGKGFIGIANTPGIQTHAVTEDELVLS